jgi:hypothetical protein
MTFNPSMCKVMHMSRKKVCSSASLQYHLNDKSLESVTHISDLGVIVSKDLSWANHIEDICTKANKTLCLIKQVCARDVREFKIYDATGSTTRLRKKEICHARQKL